MNRNTEDWIPFARPSLDEREETAVLRVLRSGWLTTASEAQAFEEEFAASVGSRHAIAVSSGTAGLHLALEAAGVKPGSLVITTPYTFTATAEVIRYLGADPLFVDVREDDLTLDPAGVERAARAHANVSAVLPVHLGGHPCDMDPILATAAKTGAAVVEDAAHAFPGRYRDRPLGTLGTAGVFSFYATKTITTGEGGMVTTNDDALARRMSVMRLHGIDRVVWNRYTSRTPGWEYRVVEAGYKYNLPDILAAMGRVQLEKAEQFHRRRREIAAAYREAFSSRDYLRLPPDRPGSSWHLYVIRIRPGRLTIDRNEYIERLSVAGIGTSVHYIPLHIMPYYRDRYDLRPDDFPVSLEAYGAAISLPIYPGLDDESVRRVIAAVIEIGDGALRH